MNKVYLDENIFYIEDFVDKDSLLIFKKEIEDITSLSKEHEGMYHDVFTFSTDKSQIVWDRITKDLKDLFDNENEYLYNFPPISTIIKYVNRESKLSGWAMYPHSDKDDLSEYGSNVLKGIVIYITDDFEGGEIVYINKDIKIKPKAGSLVCHPGSSEYTHGVNNFVGGDRVVVSAFIHKK